MHLCPVCVSHFSFNCSKRCIPISPYSYNPSHADTSASFPCLYKQNHHRNGLCLTGLPGCTGPSVSSQLPSSATLAVHPGTSMQQLLVLALLALRGDVLAGSPPPASTHHHAAAFFAGGGSSLQAVMMSQHRALRVVTQRRTLQLWRGATLAAQKGSRSLAVRVVKGKSAACRHVWGLCQQAGDILADACCADSEEAACGWMTMLRRLLCREALERTIDVVDWFTDVSHIGALWHLVTNKISWAVSHIVQGL